MIIFSPVGSHQSRKPRWMQCSTQACVLLCHLNTANHTTAKTQSCPQMWSHASRGLQGMEGLLHSEISPRNWGTPEPDITQHSHLWTGNHGRKYLCAGSWNPNWWLGFAGQRQKWVEVTRDCTSQEALMAALVRPLYVNLLKSWRCNFQSQPCLADAF